MEVSGQLHAPATLPPRERTPGTHWMGGWVGPRSVLDYVYRTHYSKGTLVGPRQRCHRTPDPHSRGQIRCPAQTVTRASLCDPRQLSHYTHWTTVVRTPAGAALPLLATPSRPGTGPNQPPIEQYLGLPPGCKAAGARGQLVASNHCQS
jgi:hypothetical protein